MNIFSFSRLRKPINKSQKFWLSAKKKPVGIRNTWARVGGTGGIPPPDAKKCSRLPQNFYLLLSPRPKFLQNSRKKEKICNFFTKAGWEFFGCSTRPTEKFPPSFSPLQVKPSLPRGQKTTLPPRKISQIPPWRPTPRPRMPLRPKPI